MCCCCTVRRFKEEFKIRERKFELYGGGEELFALPRTEYADLEKTKKELKLSDQVQNNTHICLSTC